MSALGQYVLDKNLTNYDLLGIKILLNEKVTDLISKKGLNIILGDVGYSAELILQNFNEKEKTKEAEDIEPYLVRLQNLSGINIGYFRRSGNVLIRYFFLDEKMRRNAEMLAYELVKLGKSYKFKPFDISFDVSDNAMNVHLPLNSRGIEFLTKLEERLDIGRKI